MKYEDIKLVLMLMFRNLRTTDYDFKMGKKRWRLTVRIRNDEKPICKSCEYTVKIYSPYLLLNMDVFHLSCIEWKNNIEITNKLLMDKEEHARVGPKWP